MLIFASCVVGTCNIQSRSVLVHHGDICFAFQTCGNYRTGYSAIMRIIRLFLLWFCFSQVWQRLENVALTACCSSDIHDIHRCQPCWNYLINHNKPCVNHVYHVTKDNVKHDEPVIQWAQNIHIQRKQIQTVSCFSCTHVSSHPSSIHHTRPIHIHTGRVPPQGGLSRAFSSYKAVKIAWRDRGIALITWRV